MAAVFAAASEGFSRIMGHEHLWMLKTALEERQRIVLLSSRRPPDNLETQPDRHTFSLAAGHHRLRSLQQPEGGMIKPPDIEDDNWETIVAAAAGDAPTLRRLLDGDPTSTVTLN